MIHTNEPELDTCDHASGTILARGALTSGGSMHQGTTGRTRPVIDRRNNKAVREIAKLRAPPPVSPPKAPPAAAAWSSPACARTRPSCSAS